MNEMVERVAKAMESAELEFSLQLVRLVDGVSTFELNYSDRIGSFEFSNSEDAYEHISHRKALARARAAIEAMREPTDPVLEAGSNNMSKGIDWSLEEGEGIDGYDASPVWHAMIDAALAEDGE